MESCYPRKKAISRNKPAPKALHKVPTTERLDEGETQETRQRFPTEKGEQFYEQNRQALLNKTMSSREKIDGFVTNIAEDPAGNVSAKEHLLKAMDKYREKSMDLMSFLRRANKSPSRDELTHYKGDVRFETWQM